MYEGLREGETAKETSGYAPVVEWGTLRMLLTLVVQHDLHTTQVDFHTAFTQAPLERPMFMELPQGLRDDPKFDGKILQLDRSLYGHRYGAKLFYKLIQDALTSKELGFTCSTNDHCLFLRNE